MRSIIIIHLINIIILLLSSLVVRNNNTHYLVFKELFEKSMISQNQAKRFIHIRQKGIYTP